MSDLLKKTVDLAGAYMARNQIASQDVARLISNIHGTLQTISRYGTMTENEPVVPQPQPPAPASIPVARGRGRPRLTPRPEVAVAVPQPVTPGGKAIPAIPIEDAVTDEAVLCLECGKSCRALKGHLDRIHNLDPDSYRRKYGLERDFPLVAPAYSEVRRKLAVHSGLGNRRVMQEEDA